MIVYSKRIMIFIHEIKKAVKEILSKEIRLKVAGDRFYDWTQTASYPIKIVVHCKKSVLGYFDPTFYELGFHERLMHATEKTLHDLIRHELAHYITFINHGGDKQPHGPEFRSFCEQMNWGEGVYKASLCFENDSERTFFEESDIFRKVKKLMALAGSSNKNEAEQAMIKSQQLLLKHNVEYRHSERQDDEKICLKRVMQQKKENAKMRSIAQILSTFFVSVIYRRTEHFTSIEILGDATNVDVAEYVALVLADELENLWEIAKESADLKGLVAKNSFFLGLAKGYCNKIQALKQSHQDMDPRALMIIEKKLTDAKAMVYGRLSSSKRGGSLCQKSSLLGEQMGCQLHIKPAIAKASTDMATLLLARA